MSKPHLYLNKKVLSRATRPELSRRESRGFTLIELMTALTIFTIIMTISIGSILGIFDANRKSRSLKDVMNNLNLVVESISKEMRYGQNYYCGSAGTGPGVVPQNCAGGGTLVSFRSSANAQITYQLINNTIEKKVDAGDFISMTAPESVIDDLKFYVLGAIPGDAYQPKVIIMVRGHAGEGRSRSDFVIQTLVSQRALDI